MSFTISLTCCILASRGPRSCISGIANTFVYLEMSAGSSSNISCDRRDLEHCRESVLESSDSASRYTVDGESATEKLSGKKESCAIARTGLPICNVPSDLSCALLRYTLDLRVCSLP
nr:hypothetical protein CFP56_69079 [Quercus suber]POF02166.1 hypothetical protein CFP56_69081 [Quercus suber]